MTTSMTVSISAIQEDPTDNTTPTQNTVIVDPADVVLSVTESTHSEVTL